MSTDGEAEIVFEVTTGPISTPESFTTISTPPPREGKLLKMPLKKSGDE